MITKRREDGAMSNDAKGWTGPQFRSAPLMTSAVLVGVGTFSSSLAWPWAARICCRRRDGG